MRTTILAATVLIGVMVCGCQEPSIPLTQDNLNPVKPTFPATADSPEKQEFLAVANRKEDIDKRRQDLKDQQGTERGEYAGLYPVEDQSMGAFGEGPPPPLDPEFEKQNNAHKAKHRELAQKHRAEEREVNVEYLAFMANEYWPAVLKYAEFCHKQFLADPSVANGGELYLLTDQLYENGNLDEAFLYSSDLIKNGFASAGAYDLAAAAAFCTDHLDLAQEFIKDAEKVGPTPRTTLVCNPAELQAALSAWETEEAIRAEEAAKDDLPRVKLETEVGDIIVELFEDQAPETVANFIRLVESGFYDDKPFFAMVLTVAVYHGQNRQGGRGRNRGGDQEDGADGVKLDGLLPNEAVRPDARFAFRGALTLTQESQAGGNTMYGISFRPLPHTKGFYTTFGRVIEGFDVFPKIAKTFTRNPMNGMEQTKVIKATVVRKRDHDYIPKTVPASTTETAQN